MAENEIKRPNQTGMGFFLPFFPFCHSKPAFTYSGKLTLCTGGFGARRLQSCVSDAGGRERKGRGDDW